MEVAAEKATELPKLGKPRMKLNAHTSQTDMKRNENSQCFCYPRFRYEIVKRQTGTNRGTPPMVHFVQELGAWDRTVAAKGVHHPRIRCYGKCPAKRTAAKQKREYKINMKVSPAVPAKKHRPDDNHLSGVVIALSILIFAKVVTHHQYNRTLLADRIQENLGHWLTRRRCDRRLVILDREKQAQVEEPAEDCRGSNRHDNANWSRHSSIVGLFSHMRARIES